MPMSSTKTVDPKAEFRLLEARKLVHCIDFSNYHRFSHPQTQGERVYSGSRRAEGLLIRNYTVPTETELCSPEDPCDVVKYVA